MKLKRKGERYYIKTEGMRSVVYQRSVVIDDPINLKPGKFIRFTWYRARPITAKLDIWSKVC